MTDTRRNFLAITMSVLIPALSRINTALAAEDSSPPIFYDADGLIVHKDVSSGKLDGGDTAQREGWYWLGVWVRENILKEPWTVPRTLSFQDVIASLEPKKDGVFYRHPKLAPWNNPFDKEFGFSRDQMTPLIAAMGVWGETTALRRLWNALPQDVVGGTKHTFNGEWIELFGHKTVHTGDIVGPATINLFRRAWNENPNNSSDGNGPWGEGELLANTGLKIPPKLQDRDDTGNDLNHIVELLMSIIRDPSEASAAAVKIYSKNRLVSYGSFASAYHQAYGGDILKEAFTTEMRQRLDHGIESGWQTDAGRVHGAVRWYHRESTGANPKLAELYEPIIRAYFQ